MEGRWVVQVCVAAVAASICAACGGTATPVGPASPRPEPTSAPVSTPTFDPCLTSLLAEIEVVLRASAGAHRTGDVCGYSARSGILTFTFTRLPAAETDRAIAQAVREDSGTASTTHAVPTISVSAVEVTDALDKANGIAIVFTTGMTLVNIVFNPSTFRPIRLDVAALDRLAQHVGALVSAITP